MAKYESGFLVRINDVTNYRGIDCSNEENIWPKIDEWNQKHPFKRIDINKFIGTENSIRVFDYFRWVKGSLLNLELSLLYFDNQQEIKPNIVIKEHKFNFIGFECVYLKNEYSEPILFSPFQNEIYDKKNKHLYLTLQNSYHLFMSLYSATQYLLFRKNLMNDNNYNIETAYNEYKLEITRVFEFFPI